MIPDTVGKRDILRKLKHKEPGKGLPARLDSLATTVPMKSFEILPWRFLSERIPLPPGVLPAVASLVLALALALALAPSPPVRASEVGRDPEVVLAVQATPGGLDSVPDGLRIRGSQDLLPRIDSMIAAEMARTPWAGLTVAVEKGGALLLARGYGWADLENDVAMHPDAVFRIGSVTKQFTSTAVLQLMEQGRLSLDDEITRFLPDYPVQGHHVTLRHLLTHTSGIKSYTEMGHAFWDKSRLDLTHEEMLDLFASEPFDFAPGERWEYDNSGYYLLGMIIEAVSGEPYADYLARHVLRPAGLIQTSYCDQKAVVPHRTRGYSRNERGVLVNADPLSMAPPGAAGALCSTALDLLKWQHALDSGLVLSPASRRLQLTEATLNDGSSTGYALGLGLGDLEGHRSVSHSGGINGFTSMLATYPDDGLTVAALGNTEGVVTDRVAENIARIVLGLELETLLDLPIPAEEISRYVGDWRFPEVGVSARIYQAEGQLFFAIPDEPPSRLMNQGNGLYVMSDNPNQRLVFPAGTAPAGTLELGIGRATYTGVRGQG